ncbi:MAG: hypothetical protein ACJA2J_001959 [Candidatus Azotimanducaceae bacterium]|jgi:hypothetical protein
MIFQQTPLRDHWRDPSRTNEGYFRRRGHRSRTYQITCLINGLTDIAVDIKRCLVVAVSLYLGFLMAGLKTQREVCLMSLAW